MILYFSGTGNSRFAAEKIAAALNDEIISINEIIKYKKTAVFASDRPYVFVLPVYAGRMPRVVEECIRKMELGGNRQVYFIMTCSETPYSSEKYIRRLCRKKGLELKGFDYVCMPQNYIAMYEVPSHQGAVEIYRRALPEIGRIAAAIKSGQQFDHKASGGMMSDIINPVFYRTSVSAKGFHTTDKCVGCGECAKLCPLNNIRLDGGRPNWGNDCTHCMACINGCPQQAIEYKKATVGKSRNYNIGDKI